MSDRLAKVTAMVNAHSHAFQRGLRGRAERPTPAATGVDDFWSWREEMYRLAGSLDPASMERVSLASYREMAAAGYGVVGEFHYVHHRADGTSYDDVNAMAKAVARAAWAAGLRIVLLPAAYHRGGPGRPATPGQRRFCDADVEAFLARVDDLRAWAEHQEGVSVGVAAHSTRAVPAAWLERIAAYSERHGVVRHVHGAEQPREVDEVRAEHGCSPIELLDRTGFLGPLASVVHAVHMSARDIDLLVRSATTVVTCPTTEGSLGDGHPPLAAFEQAGVRLAIGSDSQVRIDPFEEARELEALARRERGTRRALLAATGDLWHALAQGGATSLGIADEPLPTIDLDLDHPTLEGIGRADLPLALATCASAASVVSAPPRS